MIRIFHPLPVDSLKLLVFDLDGTLIDSAQDLCNSVNASLAHVGRHRLPNPLIASFVVCFLMAFLLFKTNSSFSPIIFAEIAVLALFFGASQGILSLYIPALFPAAIRASATGFCFNIGRVLTALAVLFAGVLVDVLGGYGNSLFIFSLVFLPGLFAVVFIKNIQPVQPVE